MKRNHRVGAVPEPNSSRLPLPICFMIFTWLCRQMILANIFNCIVVHSCVQRNSHRALYTIFMVRESNQPRRIDKNVYFLLDYIFWIRKKNRVRQYQRRRRRKKKSRTSFQPITITNKKKV